MFSTIWNTQRFTELGREEKGEGGDRGDLVEKKESPKGERAVKPIILPGESHGQRSLVGYSSWGRKELGVTELRSTHIYCGNTLFNRTQLLTLKVHYE